MKILACGSRDFTDASMVQAGLEMAARIGAFLGQEAQLITLIHGEARGADMMAAAHAKMLGWKVLAYPAPWEKLGKRAGPYRNQRMVEQNPDVCVAFLALDANNIGTHDMIDRCSKARIPVLMFSA